MISEGATAPGFELPALVEGEKRRVALSEYLGDDVVILAFYPADFNPACDEESCDLDELDLFTMQKDVTILGISPDSVYSHRAFARQYDLKVPLLADTDGEVAARYDIDLLDDIGQRLLERAVVVVDHDGTVTYSWSTDDMTELPRVEELKDALAETGGDDTAFARYRVGHAHYTEGRRAFTSAMEAFENTEWVMAQHDFQQACDEFEEAADRFDTALRFVDDDSLVPIYEGANEKATALWQAADWLVRSASAYSSGSGTEGQELRDDAEIPLSTVREYREPPDPDGEWPPELENLEKAESDDHSILPTEADVEDAALDVDLDEEATDGDDETTESPSQPAVEADDGSDDADDDIDDDELAEIQAELAANNPDSEPSVEEESTAIVEAPPMGESDKAADADDVPAESTSIADAPSMDGTDADSTADQGDEPVAVEEAAESTAVDDSDADASARSADAADGGVGDTAAEAPDGEPAEPAAAGDSDTDVNGVSPVQSDGEGPGATPGMATDGSEAVAAADGDGTDGDSSEDGTAGQGDDAGPELQLELAEPDPDPIDADGPPAPPADEAVAESPDSGADEESGPDE